MITLLLFVPVIIFVLWVILIGASTIVLRILDYFNF